MKIEWLLLAGLINVAFNGESPKIPISTYAKNHKFKIYMHDTGLFGARLNIASDMIVHPNRLFKEFNGAFIENYVAQELMSLDGIELFYWTSKNDAEVDFLCETEKAIYPLKVKSGTIRNLKNLQSYASKYNSDQLIRISPRNLWQTDNFINIPLWGVTLLKKLIKR